MMIIDHVKLFLPSLTRFFGEDTPKSSRHRTRVGLLLAVILLPLLLAVLACMPVPVGDPEKSQVDSAISGVWLADLDEDAPLVVFDPYDKRTWLVSWFNLKEETSLDSEQSDGVSAIRMLQENQYAITNFIMFKGWLTRIQGERILTLESKTFEPGVTPEHWWVFRVRSDGMDHLELTDVDYEFEGLKDAKTPAEAEEIIRQNLENPDFFEDPTIYHRVSSKDLETVNELFEELGMDDGT